MILNIFDLISQIDPDFLVLLICPRRLHVRSSFVNVAENDHFIVLRLTGMDAGSNGDHAFGQNMR